MKLTKLNKIRYNVFLNRSTVSYHSRPELLKIKTSRYKKETPCNKYFWIEVLGSQFYIVVFKDWMKRASFHDKPNATRRTKKRKFDNLCLLVEERAFKLLFSSRWEFNCFEECPWEEQPLAQLERSHSKHQRNSRHCLSTGLEETSWKIFKLYPKRIGNSAWGNLCGIWHDPIIPNS